MTNTVNTEIFNKANKAFEKSKSTREFSNLVKTIKEYTPKMQALLKMYRSGAFEYIDALQYKTENCISTLYLRFSLFSMALKRELCINGVTNEHDLENCVRLAIDDMSHHEFSGNVAEALTLKITMNTVFCKNPKPFPWDKSDWNSYDINTCNL